MPFISHIDQHEAIYCLPIGCIVASLRLVVAQQEEGVCTVDEYLIKVELLLFIPSVSLYAGTGTVNSRDCCPHTFGHIQE